MEQHDVGGNVALAKQPVDWYHPLGSRDHDVIARTLAPRQQTDGSNSVRDWHGRATQDVVLGKQPTHGTYTDGDWLFGKVGYVASLSQ